MTAVDKSATEKLSQRGTCLVSAFLSSLDSIASVAQNQNAQNMLTICTQKTKAKKTIAVICDDGRSEGLFIETLVTTRIHQSYNIKADVGFLYAAQADYIFYLSGNTLYTLPTPKFRYWVEHKSSTLRQGCIFQNTGGCEILHHGYFVPRQKLRTDFAKGDVRVSIFRFKVEGGKFLDFVQEM